MWTKLLFENRCLCTFLGIAKNFVHCIALLGVLHVYTPICAIKDDYIETNKVSRDQDDKVKSVKLFVCNLHNLSYVSDVITCS